MPKCRPCLGTEVKQAIVREFPQLAKRVNAVPTCPEPEEIVMCPCRDRGQPRAKRPPSAYNRFIGTCLKQRPENTPVSEAMKSCAAKWKQGKRQGGQHD